MAEITIEQLSNSTDDDKGSGVFDVLIQSVLRHIKAEYDEGRITGSDYANVYLGSMQSTLAEAVKFLLQEQQAGFQADLTYEQVLSEKKNNEPNGLIDLEKEKLRASINLIIAQTAETDAKELLVDAQTSKVGSEELHDRFLAIGKMDKELGFDVTFNLSGDISAISMGNAGLIDENITKTQKETKLLQSKDLEQIAATIRADKENGEKIKLMQAQTSKVSSEELHERFLAIGKMDKELGFNVSFNLSGVMTSVSRGSAGLIDENITKVQEEIDLLQSKDLEQIAATARADSENAKKLLLMQAQTTGFASDTKLKALKQMFEGYAIIATTQGDFSGINMPLTSSATKIDNAINNIFLDWGVVI
jgi:hypothetical protein